MTAWFASGRAVDLVIIIAVAEFLILLAWRRRAWAGGVVALAANLGAGLFLLLALRAALAGLGWWVWTACLAGAGLAHAVDLRIRLSRR